MNLIADLLQLFVEDTLRDVRQEEQKFVAAIADEHIRLPDVLPHHVGGGLQRHVAGLMTEGVIAELQVVKIQHRNAGVLHHLFQVVFIVPPVIRPRDHVPIELFPIRKELVHQLLAAFRIDQNLVVQLLDQLQYIRFSVDLQVVGRGLIDVRLQIFELCLPGLFLKGPGHHAVFAGEQFPRPSRTAAGDTVLGEHRLIFQNLFDGFPVNEPCHRKHFPIETQHLLSLLHSQHDCSSHPLSQ